MCCYAFGAHLLPYYSSPGALCFVGPTCHKRLLAPRWCNPDCMATFCSFKDSRHLGSKILKQFKIRSNESLMCSRALGQHGAVHGNAVQIGGARTPVQGGHGS